MDDIKIERITVKAKSRALKASFILEESETLYMFASYEPVLVKLWLLK
jgi:hypothetical protein